jgi:hypothetical protein
MDDLRAASGQLDEANATLREAERRLFGVEDRRRGLWKDSQPHV